MLHFSVVQAFDDFLSDARTYYHVRSRSGAPLPELTRARLQLDRSRERLRRLRMALHPSPADLESVAHATWCESLGAVIHIRRSDCDGTGSFACPCGQSPNVHPDRPEDGHEPLR